MNKIYDCSIIGGGIAGLTLAIQLRKLGYEVCLFEKNKYPFHKVCGEYVSMESYDFIKGLGLDLDKMNLPMINEVKVTSQNGYSFQEKLDLGGFGISRYTLDSELAKIAINLGVEVFDNTKVNDVKKAEIFSIMTSDNTYRAKIVCGAFGKHNTIFTDLESNSDYIAVKYHIKTDFPSNRIELHNFEGGYCGISKIDNDRFCMCYLMKTQNLKANKNSISETEKNVLYKNKNLKKYFTESEFLYERPITLSKSYFGKRKVMNSNIILLGDSAGSIAPIFGNGMSIAMRNSFELTKILDKYLKNQIDIKQLEVDYQNKYDELFYPRIKRSIFLQKSFGKVTLTDLTIGALSWFPSLTKKIIATSHGEKF